MGNGLSIRLRKAGPRDMKFLWRLRNQKEVVKQSLSCRKVPLPEHKRWFESRVNDFHTDLFLVLLGKNEIGQVRFDVKKGHSIANISISNKFSGNGYGAKSLKLATAKHLKSGKTKKIVAFIKKDNQPSVACFEEAGYKHVGKKNHKGILCFKLIRVKNNG